MIDVVTHLDVDRPAGAVFAFVSDQLNAPRSAARTSRGPTDDRRSDRRRQRARVRATLRWPANRVTQPFRRVRAWPLRRLRDPRRCDDRSSVVPRRADRCRSMPCDEHDAVQRCRSDAGRRAAVGASTRTGQPTRRAGPQAAARVHANVRSTDDPQPITAHDPAVSDVLAAIVPDVRGHPGSHVRCSRERSADLTSGVAGCVSAAESTTSAELSIGRVRRGPLSRRCRSRAGNLCAWVDGPREVADRGAQRDGRRCGVDASGRRRGPPAVPRDRRSAHLRAADDQPYWTEGLTRAATEQRAWVAIDDLGAVVGFAVAWVIDGEGHLDELAVTPAHGRRGIGRALVDEVLRPPLGGCRLAR